VAIVSIIALLPNLNPYVKNIYAVPEIKGMDDVIHPLSDQTSYFDPLQKEANSQDTGTDDSPAGYFDPLQKETDSQGSGTDDGPAGYFDPLQKETDSQGSGTDDGSVGRTVNTKHTPLHDNANHEKMAIITFDDGWESQYKNAKPILDKYNFKATFYVIGNDIGKDGRLGWPEIKQLQNEGHEIGSHSMSHVNLDKISPGEQEYEIAESKKYLEDNGIVVNGFSYPFNSGDDDKYVLDEVSKHYKYARTAGMMDSKNTDYQDYTLVGQSFNWVSKEIKDSNLQMLNMFKEYVNKHHSTADIYDVPILIYHRVDNTEGQTSPDLFNAEMEYLYENNFKVVTMHDVYNQN
jgi:peptidoglycan/xylan/chitin deacetylase (PgdA/CDA1 family)